MSSTPSLATHILEAKFLKEIKRDHKCSLERVALSWLLYQSYTHINSITLKTENTLNPYL